MKIKPDLMSQLSAGSCPSGFPQVVPPVNYSLPLFLSPLTSENSLPPDCQLSPGSLLLFPHASPRAQLQLHRHSYFISCASPRSTATTPPQLLYPPRFTALNCNYTATVTLFFTLHRILRGWLNRPTLSLFL